MSNAIIRKHIEAREAPLANRGIVGWIRNNLFSTWYHSFITLILFWVVGNIMIFLFDWGFINAVWVGESAKSCPNIDGACWAFIVDRWQLIVYGLVEKHMHWRVNLFYLFAVTTAVVFIFSFGKHNKIIRTVVFIGFPITGYFLLVGGSFGLERVEPDKWGGLVLTLV